MRIFHSTHFEYKYAIYVNVPIAINRIYVGPRTAAWGKTRRPSDIDTQFVLKMGACFELNECGL